jgi:hypothetical protein
LAEPFDWLTGESGDEVVVLVDVKDYELGQLGCSRDEQVVDRWCTVLTSIGERSLNLNRTVFDRRGEVLHGHRAQRWHRQCTPKVVSGASRVADFEAGDRADPDESPLNAVGPLLGVWARAARIGFTPEPELIKATAKTPNEPQNPHAKCMPDEVPRLMIEGLHSERHCSDQVTKPPVADHVDRRRCVHVSDPTCRCI